VATVSFDHILLYCFCTKIPGYKTIIDIKQDEGIKKNEKENTTATGTGNISWHVLWSP